MDWTVLADGFVVAMQAASGAMLVAGAVLWIREGLRGESADPDARRAGKHGFREEQQGLTEVSRG